MLVNMHLGQKQSNFSQNSILFFKPGVILSTGLLIKTINTEFGLKPLYSMIRSRACMTHGTTGCLHQENLCVFQTIKGVPSGTENLCLSAFLFPTSRGLHCQFVSSSDGMTWVWKCCSAIAFFFCFSWESFRLRKGKDLESWEGGATPYKLGCALGVPC